MPSLQRRIALWSPALWPHAAIGSVLGRAPTLFLFFLVFWSDKVLAQQTNVTCDSSFDWALNSQGHNPCKVASELQAVCYGGWTVDSLPAGWHYIGPEPDNPRNKPNYCTCTSIVYQLMSACGACQNLTFISYPAWTIYCTNISTVEGEYNPKFIPFGGLVPNWAYIKPSSYGGLFNIEIAKLVGDTPESTQLLTSSTTSSESSSSTTSSISTMTSSSQHSTTTTTTTKGGGGGGSSNTGTIVGGVVGGVVGLGLVAVLAIWAVGGLGSGTDPSQYAPPSGGSWRRNSTNPPSMATSPHPPSQELHLVSPIQPEHHGYSGVPEV
ncbi:uncharacterized protein EI90DRAFT_2247065 [Cantharellus anzutake]|uniref:uncharacterized protein n=1 Tax=Cantharellus anzutake TaxID=1750568 RepID=UPI0019059829|nr:uncharacterized protein EI90DRAFT_2247065 [Cantharellus anzutake]KAF8339524.1 hypothetical protein EI90DRAFT_2247065 [Cantharellus anzutake]